VTDTLPVKQPLAANHLVLPDPLRSNQKAVAISGLVLLAAHLLNPVMIPLWVTGLPVLTILLMVAIGMSVDARIQAHAKRTETNFEIVTRSLMLTAEAFDILNAKVKEHDDLIAPREEAFR